MEKNIPFFRPDITEQEIKEVCNTLKSGWITSGPKVIQFQDQLAQYCGVDNLLCLSSATSALELALRILGIGEGDEVITTPYTYTSSCSVIVHVGAKPVLVDLSEDSLQMDYELLEDAITENTKAIIPVDVGGIMCDYDRIFSIVESKQELFKAKNDIQKAIGRVVVLADGAHSLGATYHGKPSGSVADFTAFSFHAVKNLTTAEGGALAWKNINGMDNEELFKRAFSFSLHGQTKSAYEKLEPGSWKYDIAEFGYKWNMTDIAASIGLAQLQRYPSMLARRKEIIERYEKELADSDIYMALHYTDEGSSSGHLALTRVLGATEQQRDEIIVKMAKKGISCNVHYRPLPMLSAYQNIGFSIMDYPNAYEMYKNEITLPLFTLLTDDEIGYIIESFLISTKECLG